MTGGETLPPSRHGPELASGLVHLLTGRAITVAVQFATLSLMGRALGPSDFGVVQLGIAVFTYVGLANDLGLTILGAREFARRSPDGESPGDLLGTRIALTIVTLVPVGLVLALAPLSGPSRWVGIVLAGGFVISSINLRWLLLADRRFRGIALADSLGAIAQLVVTIVFVVGTGNVVAAAAAVVAGPAVSTIAMIPMVASHRSVVPRFGVRGLRVLHRAMPLGVATMATAVYYSLDTVLLAIFRDPEQVGFYSAAYRIVLTCLTVPFLVHSAALPLVSHLTRDDPAKVPGLIRSISQNVLLIAAPIAVGTTLCADVVIRIVYGPDFGPAAGPLRILIWSCVTVSANVPFAVLLLARRGDGAYMRITIAGAVANFAANLVMIPAFGILGAALTTLLSECLVLASILWQTRDLSGQILRTSIARTVAPVLLMGLAVVWVRDSVIAIPIGAGAYAAAVLALRLVTVADVRAALGWVRRTPQDVSP